jgi:Ca2+-binding EF-hand superfamily protein
MDVDGDGVITRAEWRGNDQAFRRLDKNSDGVLSGDQVWNQSPATDLEAQFHRADRDGNGVLSRGEWWGDAGTFDRIDQNRDERLSVAEFLGEEEREQSPGDRSSFASLDRNGNGVITQNEWDGRHEDFVALDADRDGVITRAEYGRADYATQSNAYRAGRERGLADGPQAGREDRTINGGRWDLEGQRELETADAGYRAALEIFRTVRLALASGEPFAASQRGG